MMRYRVDYSTLEKPKELRKIDRKVLRRIHGAIEQKLAKEPELFGKPLRQSLFGNRVLRVGDYRVVYHVEQNTVFILQIAHRSVVY